MKTVRASQPERVTAPAPAQDWTLVTAAAAFILRWLTGSLARWPLLLPRSLLLVPATAYLLPLASAGEREPEPEPEPGLAVILTRHALTSCSEAATASEPDSNYSVLVADAPGPATY